MSHTSQRRGLDPSRPGQEVIVLAMVPSSHKDRSGVGAAMAELAVKMLERGPRNWLSRNFTEITVPDLGSLQAAVEWMHGHWPDATQRLLMRGVGHFSSVITALYDDTRKVVDLIDDLQGDWLERNRREGLPISIVLSGLFEDVHRCCQKTGTLEHTYLHSIGFFGRIHDLPSVDELSITTMCGHGLIAARRVRDRVEKIREGEMTPEQAAHDLARPCVCGIANVERAEGVLRRLAEKK